MSRDFTEMVEEHTKNKANQSKESKEAMMFLKQKMDAAQGFIDAVKQRQNTLMTTMQAIIDLQRPFFLEGDESLLRPMILKDVAERTGLTSRHLTRQQQQIQCKRLRHLSPEVLLQRRIHHRRR